MDFLKIFDEYDFKARFLPTVVVASPLAVAIAICAGSFDWTLGKSALGGILLVGLLYLLMQLLRNIAVSLEPRLWNSWGGPPSTRFARWRDRHFSDYVKAKIHLAIQHRLKLPTLSIDEELRNTEEADLRIREAFGLVREFLRREDPNGIWQKHNIEYGFYRNLNAGKWLLIACCVLAGAFSVTCPGRVVQVVAIEILIATGWSLFAFFVLPHLLSTSADRYADRAWSTFIERTVGNEQHG